MGIEEGSQVGTFAEGRCAAQRILGGADAGAEVQEKSIVANRSKLQYPSSTPQC